MSSCDEHRGAVESGSVESVALDTLRALGVRAAQLSGETFPAASLWRDLVDGRVRAVDVFCADDRCYLLVREAGDVERRPPQSMVRALKPILLGSLQKTVAFDLGVAASTVTLRTSACMKLMGFECRAVRAPALLVLAAYADATNSSVGCITASFTAGAARYRVVSASRPEPAKRSGLSAAEVDVACQLVDGFTREEIAAARRRSVRTVTNQVASIYRKLRVGNRSDLVKRLIADSGVVAPGNTLAA